MRRLACKEPCLACQKPFLACQEPFLARKSGRMRRKKHIYTEGVMPNPWIPHFDDPAVRFDRGWLWPSEEEILAARTQPTKKGNMITQRYYPTKAAEQIRWNDNFILKLPLYETVLNLVGAHVDACIASLKFVNYVLSVLLVAVRDFGPAATSATDLLLYGSGPDAVVLPGFTAPALPAGVAGVPPGALVRLFDLVQLIKRSPGYTDIIGKDLDIIGPEVTPLDVTAAQPAFTLEMRAGHVFVKWTWQGMHGQASAIEIHVDRADGKGFVLLTIDTTPGYLDTQDLPAAAAKWTYKAIWRDGDARIGQWSNPVSITVGG